MSEHQLALYEDSLESLLKADKLYESTNSSNQSVRKIIDKLLPNVLSRSKERHDWNKVIELCLKVGVVNTNMGSLDALFLYTCR